MTSLRQNKGILPGFGDPAVESQSVFRSIMGALAYPGRIFSVRDSLSAPAPFNIATTAICLTLVDANTPVHILSDDSAGAAVAHLEFHCGASCTRNASEAEFVVITDASQSRSIADLNCGSIEYPDKSTTAIIQVPSLISGDKRVWRGPGIPDLAEVSINGLDPEFWHVRSLVSQFPLGVDVLFTCGSALVALPRSTNVES